MKIIFCLLALLLTSTTIFCQKTKTIIKKDEYRLYEYEVLESNHDIKNGIYLEYSLNKNKELEGRYINNLKEGEWRKYDGYGRLMYIETFLNDKKNGRAQYLEYKYSGRTEPPTRITEGQYINNLQEGTWASNEKIINTQAITTYYQGKKQGLYTVQSLENTKQILIGKYKNDKMDSAWFVYDKNGKLERELFFQNDTPQKNWKFYRNDTLMLEYSFDENKIVKNNFAQVLFLDNNAKNLVENFSSFNGGLFFDNRLRREIQKRVEYPTIARRKEIQGTVYMRIIISENGEIEQIKAVKSPDTSLENATITAVKKALDMNKWTIVPAVENGKAIKSTINFSISFKLDR